MNKLRLGPIAIQGKLRSLSAEGTTLPGLVRTINLLDSAKREHLDNELVPDPAYEIGARLERILRLVVSIGGQLPYQTGRYEQQALKETEQLMLEITSATEYLRLIGSKLGDISPPGKAKNFKAANQAIDREVNLLFKAPINKIKHEGFELGWIEVTYGDGVPIAGFSVNGLIRPKTTGPAAFRYGSNAIAEGYSFAFLLRKAVQAFYQQCDILEKSIRQTFSLQPKPQPSEQPPGPAILVGEVLKCISLLPYQGFPNEHHAEVLDLFLEDGAIKIARARWLKTSKLDYSVQSHVVARTGHTFQLPYWATHKPPKSK